MIFGIGGVGLNIAQAANMVSANPIIGVDIKNSKLKMGKKFGMTYGFNGTDKSLNKKIYKVLGKKYADIVIDTTGNSRIIEQAYDLTDQKGKTILVGVPKKGDNISIYSLPLHFDKILSGSHGGSSIPDEDIPRLIKLIDSKKMSLNNIITHEFNLDQINEALNLFRKGNAGRILIKMDK